MTEILPNLSWSQRKWLRTRGGRDLRDVLFDNKDKLFVLMGNGSGGECAIYLPEDGFDELSTDEV